ncbi:hypothetical protein FPQ18DRAFT_394649 [Pyronema domesticum]|nr:hypothetical protein FPQ18DRAFT_394649 [Pyronema domesticum]
MIFSITIPKTRILSKSYASFVEAERTLALKKTPPAVASANVAAKAAKNGYCTLCETSTRDTARCRYKNKKRPNETSEESPQAQKSSKVECSYCLRNNHTKKSSLQASPQ